MPFKRKNVTQHIVRQIILAYEDTILEAFFQFENTIESEIFFWDRITRRKNGDVVFTPRNIVDTGNFLRSQYLDPVSRTEVVIGWAAPYSSTILYGRRRKDGSFQPGRDWIAATQDRWSIRDEFIHNLNKRLNGSGAGSALE